MTARWPSEASAFRAGMVAMLPILIGVVPFGLIYGVTAATLPVPDLPAWSASLIIYGGPAQVAIVQLLGVGTAGLVIVATVTVINARYLMYGAALGARFASAPLPHRAAMAYLLTDAAFALSAANRSDGIPVRVDAAFYFGHALLTWVIWLAASSVGILVGALIPESWSLDFTIPLIFLALLVPTVESSPHLIAAVVGGVVAVAARGVAFNSGLLVGAAAGVAAGMVAEARRR